MTEKVNRIPNFATRYWYFHKIINKATMNWLMSPWTLEGIFGPLKKRRKWYYWSKHNLTQKTSCLPFFPIGPPQYPAANIWQIFIHDWTSRSWDVPPALITNQHNPEQWPSHWPKAGLFSTIQWPSIATERWIPEVPCKLLMLVSFRMKQM